jgi:hypothetical protein
MRALVLAAALAGCAARHAGPVLPATTLEEGFSAAGYVYYPAGTYHTLEVRLAETRSGAVRRERAAFSETP